MCFLTPPTVNPMSIGRAPTEKKNDWQKKKNIKLISRWTVRQMCTNYPYISYSSPFYWIYNLAGIFTVTSNRKKQNNESIFVLDIDVIV